MQIFISDENDKNAQNVSVARKKKLEAWIVSQSKMVQAFESRRETNCLSVNWNENVAEEI